MKQLIFLRHAKSDWGNETLKDIDRHLNERGYNDAYFFSSWFKRNQKAPDLIICSTATRTLSTALIFARELDFNMDNFLLEKKIYESSPETLLSIISGQDDELSSIMLVGHNPTITEICNELNSDLYFDNVPTCGIVAIKFNCNTWSEIISATGRLDYHQFPKKYKQQN